MSDYKTTIGMEVHAELNTKSKMFCGCKNDPHASEPNQNTCPVCLAHPGTLPVVNKRAVEMLVMMGHAVGGNVATYSEFDRKNYFYPDIPKAYQISQYAFAFVKGGELSGVKLNRVHLEEDTARSLHDQGSGSIVDFNRAGVPLMELVTEPVIHDAVTAGNFTRELQLLLKTLGISDANMEKGEMRVEANISVSKTDTLGNLTEVKNLNSFKSMEAAIDFEVKRQIEILESGGVVEKETRGWDENKGVTFSQRSKENAEDYRYFPDPDIPKFDLAQVPEFDKTRISEILPKLATEKRLEYKNLGLEDSKIELIISTPELDLIFTSVLTKKGVSAKTALLAANYLITDVVPLLATNTKPVRELGVNEFIELLMMVDEGLINSRIAKDLLPEALFESLSPKVIAAERGLLQVNDDSQLEGIIVELLSANPDAVAEYKAGKESTLQFLVGQGMKLSRGSANPQRLAELIKKSI